MSVYWVPLSAAPSTIQTTYGTTPPATPNDGDIWILPMDTANGIMWAFRYRAASPSAYKWEFIGGPEAYTAVVTSESFSTPLATYNNLPTVGPQIVVPRSGDYWAIATAVVANSAAQTNMQLAIGVGDFSTQVIHALTSGPAGNYTSPFCEGVIGGMTAGQQIRVKYYQTAAGTYTAQERWLYVKPVRVS